MQSRSSGSNTLFFDDAICYLVGRFPAHRHHLGDTRSVGFNPNFDPCPIERVFDVRGLGRPRYIHSQCHRRSTVALSGGQSAAVTATATEDGVLVQQWTCLGGTNRNGRWFPRTNGGSAPLSALRPLTQESVDPAYLMI
jgi:hypothetical protein